MASMPCSSSGGSIPVTVPAVDESPEVAAGSAMCPPPTRLVNAVATTARPSIAVQSLDAMDDRSSPSPRHARVRRVGGSRRRRASHRRQRWDDCGLHTTNAREAAWRAAAAPAGQVSSSTIVLLGPRSALPAHHSARPRSTSVSGGSCLRGCEGAACGRGLAGDAIRTAWNS